MVVWAATRLQRPVKWTSDRSETFLSDPHGRDHVTVCEMAFDADARILAMRADTAANVGAYLLDFGPRIPTVAGARIAGSVYDAGDAAVGQGDLHQHRPDRCLSRRRPAGDLLRWSGCSTSARRLRHRPREIRRQLHPPEQLPLQNQVGMVIDSGLFAETMDRALAKADWAGARRAARHDGKLRGIGLGYYVEASGGQPLEEARVRFEPDGRVTLIVGTFSHGQGHETAFAQILAERLGVPFDRIDLRQGDSDFVKFGNGTGGSRSSQMGGVATSRAALQVIEKARRIAAHRLETAEADVEFRDGAFGVPGTDLRIAIGEIARLAADPANLPDGMEPGLDETCRYQRPTECNFPNGAHVAEVAIDPDTGVVQVERYVCVDDCGVILNPLLIRGQVHGAVAQGLGQALLEHTVYDRDSGQLVSGSFMDYAMPRVPTRPDLEVDFHVVPNPSNDLGVKGAGEGGSWRPARHRQRGVRRAGHRPHDMPLTPRWFGVVGAGLPRDA
jgi:carbon-monoxide dehydrogenase large subunit